MVQKSFKRECETIMTKENEQITEYRYEDEMKESFLDYSMSVIVSRALPDVRDGFKPVHRRVLYAMKDLGITPDSPHKKSARIVGEVIGKYHPHGDSAVYHTMVNMSQDWKMNLPLVDGHGNFGSIDGDSPAAMRYTEARLTNTALMLTSDLDKNIVDFVENYDGTETEPKLLPARIPNLLINGTFGIAVGMKSSIPTHNISEVIDAFLHYLKKPNDNIEEFVNFIQGPDYATGGTIINSEEIKNLYRTGKGRAIIRAKFEFEPAQYGKTNIVITEIPITYSGNKSRLVEGLTEMVIDKKLNELSDVRDESSKDGIRIVLEVKKGINIDQFIQKLYAKTKLQDSESYEFIALVNGKPQTLNLKSYFKYYLDFQKELNIRKYQYLYNKGLLRKETLDGLIQAIDVIDEIIELIRGTKLKKERMAGLMNGSVENVKFKTAKSKKIVSKFSFTERQAKAILEMKLEQLGALEVDDLIKNHEKVSKEIASYLKILNDEKSLMKEIRKEHEQFKINTSRPRKTIIESVVTQKYIEEKIIEDIIVTVDRFGYAKTMDACKNENEFKEIQHLNKYALETNSEDRVFVITNMGNVYQIKMKDIPKGKLKDKGSTIQAIASMDRNEYPIYVTTKGLIENETLLFVTRKGLTKLTIGTDLISSRLKIVGTKLEDNDEILFVKPVSENQKLIIQTKRGYVIRLNPNSFALMKKTSKGITSIALKEEDVLESAYLLKEKEDIDLKVNTIKISTKEFKESKRGAVGKLII